MQYPGVQFDEYRQDRWIYTVSPRPNWNVNVILTDQGSAVSTWVNANLENLVVGISVHYLLGEPANVLTLCCKDTCLVIRLGANRFSFTESFYNFLFERRRWFVGQNVGNECRDSLRLANSRLQFERLVDLRSVIHCNLGSQRQLREAAFGYNPRTTAQIEYSNWRDEPLTLPQICFTVMQALLCERIASSNEENLRILANADIAAGGQAATLAAQTRFHLAAAALPHMIDAAAAAAAEDEGDEGDE